MKQILAHNCKQRKLSIKLPTQWLKTLKKVDAAVQKTDKEISKSAKAVKKALIGEQKAAERASAAIIRAKKKETDAFNKAAAKRGRSFGQTGIQLQQFVGQVQGGQNALLAFSQQAADIGIVSGFAMTGVIVGIAASLVGILLPALFKTNEALKDFKFNVEDAAKELDKLNELSKAQVSVALKNTSKSMDDLSKATEDAGKAIAVINQQLDSGNKINVRITKTGRAVIETTKLTKEETKKLKEELAQEQANLDKINQEYKKQSDLLVKLSENKAGLNKETIEQKEAIKELSKSLEGQIIALRDGEEAALRFATAQQLGLKVGEQIPANIEEQISALFRLKKAQEDTREEDASKKKASSFATGVTKRGQDPEEKLQADLDQLIRDEALISVTEFELAKTSIEKQQSDLRKKNKSQGRSRLFSS